MGHDSEPLVLRLMLLVAVIVEVLVALAVMSMVVSMVSDGITDDDDVVLMCGGAAVCDDGVGVVLLMVVSPPSPLYGSIATDAAAVPLSSDRARLCCVCNLRDLTTSPAPTPAAAPGVLGVVVAGVAGVALLLLDVLRCGGCVVVGIGC